MRKFSLFMLMAVGLLISGNLRADNVCKIVGGDEYESLQAAIDAVPTDGTQTEIQLIATIELAKEGGAAFAIPTEKNVYLDLNGYKIVYNLTKAANAYVIQNAGTLTIDDKKDGSGVIELKGAASNGGNQPTIVTSKMLTIKNGKIYNSLNGNYAAYAVDMHPNNQPFATHKTNTLVIEGGEIAQTTWNHPAIRAYGQDYNSNYEQKGTEYKPSYSITMKGGKVWGQRGFYLSCKSGAPIALNIEGGEIEAKDGQSSMVDFRAIDSQLESGNGDLSKVTINISDNPVIKGFICLANLQGDFTQTTTENLSIAGGNFVTNNGIRFGSLTKVKAENFITGGTYFFTQTPQKETIIPRILFGQEDAKGTYACTDDLIYARYTGELATKDGWEALGYIVEKIDYTNPKKEGQWYKISKETKSAEDYSAFIPLIAEGYTAVDITGQNDGNGGTWPDKTVIVKQVETKEISGGTPENPEELPAINPEDSVVVKGGAYVNISTGTPENPVEVYSLNVEEGGSLTIEANAVVKVGDGGFGTDNEDIYVTINAEQGSSGIIKVSPDAPKTKQKVHVNLYTAAHSIYKNNEIAVSYWQLFARPTEMQVESFSIASYPTTEGEIPQSNLITNIYGYDGNHWVELHNLTDLSAKFEGYAISNNTKFGGVVYQFTGWMCLNDDAQLNFNHSGFTLMGNSYLAPVSLRTLFENVSLQGSTTVSAEQTIWYYESLTGSFKPVTWIMTQEDFYRNKQVEPMQGFFMYLANGSSMNATLSYADAVWNQTLVAHPLPAPGLGARGMNMAKITVSANGKNDEMRVYEDNDFSPAFDNGADATKMMNLDGMFNLYVATEDHNYANFATDNLEGTLLTFNACAETEYTLSFSNTNTDYQLVDLMTEEVIEMTEGNTYTFSADPNSTVERFQIVSAPLAPTAIKNAKSAKVNKIFKNGMLYLKYDGNIFNAQGQNVK